MKRRKEINNINYILFCVSCVHWLLSIQTDKYIFNLNNISDAKYWLAKVVFFPFVFMIWRFIYIALKKIKTRDEHAIKWISYSMIYAVVLCVILVCVWPGIWRTDEFGVLGNVTSLQIYWWQHFITSIFYMISLMLIPIPSGVILVQIMLVCIAFGYIAQKMEQSIGKQWSGLFFLITFCVPSVIMFHLYPMRIVLYTIVELVIWVFLYFEIERFSQLSIHSCCLLAIGNVLLAVWRTEGIYYMILLPLVIGIFNKRKVKTFKYVLYTMLVLGGSLLAIVIQQTGIKSERNDAYEITAYAQSLTPLVYQAYLESDQEGLEIVDKVIQVDEIVLQTANGVEGIECFWNGYMTSKNYSDEEFNLFKKQYVLWVFKYPQIYLSERIKTFITSYEQTKETDNLYDESNIQFVYFLNEFNGTKPILNNVRAGLIHFMENKVWTYFELPMLAMLLITLYGMKFDKKMAALTSLIIVRIPLVFITAPDNYFMYYYPMYLIGNFLMIYFILLIKEKKYAQT